jgi:hypothetical protein
MRRVKGEYENLKAVFVAFNEQARGYAAELDAAGRRTPADVLRVVMKRLENIRTLSAKLGNTAPGLDEATMQKIGAEWAVCRRMVAGTLELVRAGASWPAFAAAVKDCEACLQSLAG